MKLISVLLAGLLLASPAFSRPETCEEKTQQVKKEIAYAEANGNTRKITGLKIALSDIEKYCSNDQIKEEYNQKISKKKQEVSEAESELKKEISGKNNPKKIAKKRKKVEEKKAELKALENI